VKHEHATKRRSALRTGGGAPPPDLPQESEKVLDILGPEINDIGNPYDDDGTSSVGKLSLGPCFWVPFQQYIRLT